MSNIVDFNKARVEKITRRMEETLLEAEEQQNEIEGLAADIVYDIIDFFDEVDIDVRENPNTIYDIILLIEVLKSLIHRCMNEEYPTQKVAESLMTIEDPKKILDDFLG